MILTDILARPFHELVIEHDAAREILWTWMAFRGRPTFNHDIMEDFDALQTMVTSERHAGGGVRYNVLASRFEGLYCLGGDLEAFAANIRAGDLEGMRRYADLAIKTVYGNGAQLARADVMSIALVQGDALGGGFEAALSSNAIVAETGARFGLPELLFNLFPGMGAFSLLTRKLGSSDAQRFIVGAKTHGAEELFDMGLVHALAAPGKGVEALNEFVDGLNRTPERRALFAMEEETHGLGYEEMHDVVMQWAEAALRLSPRDVKMMERLVAAQYRRIGSPGR
jgi:DSF synthase